MSRNILFIVGAILLCVADGRAQVIAPPPRSTPAPPRTGAVERISNNLDVTVDVTGGFDRYGAGAESLSDIDPIQYADGFRGTASTGLNFRRGNLEKAFEVRSELFADSYSHLGESFQYGGVAAVHGDTKLGDRHQVRLDLNVSSQPLMTLGTFSGIQDAVDGGVIPAADRLQGVVPARSLAGHASLELSRSWTTRQQSRVEYAANKREFGGQEALDSRDQMGSLSHAWDMSRAASVQTAYRYTDQIMEELDGGTRPFVSHVGELGLSLRKGISRQRQVTVSGGGGATHVATVNAVSRQPYSYVAPSGYAGVRMDIGRSWALSADLRRAVSVMEGVTAEAFVSDAGSLSLGGQFGSRSILTFSGAAARGVGAGNAPGSFNSVSGAAQLQYTVSRRVSFVSSYTFYRHHTVNILTLPTGMPPRYQRHTIQVGASLNLPIVAPPLRTPRRGQD
jgi:hypothetical protein